jgi:hypothetical protein
MARLLSAEEHAAYARDGWLIKRGLVPAGEIAAISAETEQLLSRGDLMAQNNLRVRWQYHYLTGAPIFELFDPITDIAPACDALARGPRLTGLLAELLDGPVCLYKDKLIYKPPGAGGYPLHQDFIAWRRFPESFTTVVVAIDPAGDESGAIELYPGAQRGGCLAERDGNFHILPDDAVAGFPAVRPALEPGDALVFGAFMPHRSDINRSTRSRRHLLLSYNAAREGGDLRAEHYRAFHHWLRSMYGAMGLGDLYFK